MNKQNLDELIQFADENNISFIDDDFYQKQLERILYED